MMIITCEWTKQMAFEIKRDKRHLHGADDKQNNNGKNSEK